MIPGQKTDSFALAFSDVVPGDRFGDRFDGRPTDDYCVILKNDTVIITDQ